MNNKYIKVIIGALVFCITIVGLYVFADITSMKTLSRVEVTETPLNDVKLVGGYVFESIDQAGDQNTNHIVATKDGGWIATINTDNTIIKFNANGTEQWRKSVNPTIYGTAMIMNYPDKEEKPVYYSNQYTPRNATDIVPAYDGGYFLNYSNIEGILAKIDKDGNIEWQSDVSNYYYDQVYTDICEGSADADGKVMHYWVDKTTGEVSFSNMQTLQDYEKIDDTHYYCKDYIGTYYNRYYYNGGILTPLPDGGVALLTASADYSGAWILSDGTKVPCNSHYKWLLIYDKDGKFVQALDTYNLYQAGGEAYATSHGVANTTYYMSNDIVFHDYVGAYKNGDILLAVKPGFAAMKLRKNASTGQYEPLWFTPLGFNGVSPTGGGTPLYANGDGTLQFYLDNNNGGFYFKHYDIRPYSTSDTKLDFYNVPELQYDVPMEPNYWGDYDYVTSAGYVFRFNEKNTNGTITPYLDDITIIGNTGRPDTIPAGSNIEHRISSMGGINGTGIYKFDDGSYLVTGYSRIYDYSPQNNYVILKDGTRYDFTENSFIVYRVDNNNEVVWIKEFKGMNGYYNISPHLRISQDGRKILVPIRIAANATVTQVGNDDIPVITNPYSSDKSGFLVFDLLFNREETIIPDPTTTTSTTKPTKTTTTKTTKTKKTKTTTTEPVEEETTETTTTTSTSTTSRTTTTKQKEEVKGEEKKKPDVKKIVTIVGISFVGLFIGGFTFYFIPFVIIPRRKRVLVAMSGGPGSAVAAKKLLDKHYKVYGLFISNSSNLQAFSNAKQIANKLEIDLFEQEINDVYRAKLSEGIAANPNTDLDKIYNKYILLEALKDVAKEQHIKYIATGHYATKKSGSIQAGVNQVFDESDKLSLLTSDDIKKLLLPIGELDYQEVTKIAEANNINLTNTKQTPEEKIGSTNITK